MKGQADAVLAVGIFVLIMSARTLAAQPEFSFKYNGVASSNFFSGWNYSTTTKSNEYGIWNVDVYSDPATLLEVRCEKLNHAAFNATEWVVWFENKGAQNTPILSEIQAGDFLLTSASAGAFKVNYNKGSQITDADYQPYEVTIASPLVLAPFEGRSSAWNALPFFNVQKPDGTGAIMAIGWTGQWQTTFSNASGGANPKLRLVAGMQLTNLKLLPGEKIRTPAILRMTYSGDRVTAQNQFRRLLRAQYTPKQNGQVVTDFPQSANPYCSFTDQSVITRTDVTNFVNALVAYQHPTNAYVWLDAGWYPCASNWQNTGTWQADAARFPGGLLELANYIHARGYKFTVWFEPERVAPNTWLYTNQPAWLLTISPGLTLVNNERLLNFGHPAALAWAKNTFSSFIKTNKIDIYRQDFNSNPLSGWRNADASDRQGITEIKYVMGLYEFWDTLRSENPDLLIDNCASGGMRYDLELIKRSFTLWRDDDCWNSDVEQCYTYGLATWFPVGGRGTVTTDPYDWQSGAGAIFLSCPEINNATKNNYITAHLPEYKALRALFTGDFYPLTSYSLSSNVWMAWQFHAAETNAGIVQTFRRQNSSTNAMTFKLRGLNATDNYELHNIDTKETNTISGSSLMSAGLTITLGPRKSALIKYSSQVTNPPIVISQLSLTASNKLAFAWTSAAGRLYQVQYLNNVPGAAWSNWGGEIRATNIHTATEVDMSGPFGWRFYRIKEIE